MTATPWTRDEFEKKLRDKEGVYHIHHPVNRALNEGRATAEQIRLWVANRWYYQISIPVKDAAILSNCPDHDWRRRWISRILDHDGYGDDAGGIEAWEKLADAVGLPRNELEDQHLILPGVRFAVDAYINFARRAPWQEAVTSSLTEMFATNIQKERLANWPTHYPWIADEGLTYFRNRTVQAPRDVEQALALTLDYYSTREAQEHAVNILQFKINVLWQMNDAMAPKFGLGGDI